MIYKYAVSLMSHFDNVVKMHVISGPNDVWVLKKLLSDNQIEVEGNDVDTIIEECFNMDIAIGIVQVD